MRASCARFGQYDVLAPLASGGMGGVYLASHVATGERVALKVLDPQLVNHREVVTRLYNEHAMASRAHHPGVVDIRSAARSVDQLPYLVMEYLEGETLAQMSERAPLDLSTIVAFGAQIASAVAALHAGGVVHCDLKPENLFVCRDRLWSDAPALKVIDFGVSRLVDEPPPDDASIAGTPAYMAPEQWRGFPQPASDVYALACVLFELITGNPPYEGSLPELMTKHCEQRPPRPSWLRAGVAPDLERLILRSLAKDPEHRPSMDQVAADLAELADIAMASETLRMAV